MADPLPNFRDYIHRFETVPSTNQLALEAARAGVETGVWVAGEQTAGRGRGGHTWHSAAADGLYLSVLLRLQTPVSEALLLSLATGLAARAAIDAVTGLTIDLRWPNDLMLNGRKCGGILVETAIAPAEDEAGARFRHVVIGIGINLNHVGFPADLAKVATSLRQTLGAEIDREALFTAVLDSLALEMESLASGTAEILGRFAAASSWVQNKRVRVGEQDGYTGVTAGLDPRGFLLVDCDDGARRTVLSGGVREAER